MPKVEKQWTKRNGVITKKPVGSSTRGQVKRHKELKHNLITALTSSEEYTYEEYSVSLDTDDGQIKSGSKFRVSDVGLFETETRGPNESFELWRFSGEILRNETDLQATDEKTLSGIQWVTSPVYFISSV